MYNKIAHTNIDVYLQGKVLLLTASLLMMANIEVES